MNMENNQEVNTDNGVKKAEEVDINLLEAVRRQVEYYFSKENLQNDKFLAAQMDAQMSVPISVIMKFAKMKALTNDEEVVKAALADSSVTVVNNRIKANIKMPGRSTIILREIPTEASEDEVREIFDFEGCKNICSIRSDIGDTWFVVMDSEEDAKDTVIALRLKKRTFRGNAVKARVKTDTVIRQTFFPTNVSPIPAPLFPVMPFPIIPPVPADGSMIPPYFIPVPPGVDLSLGDPAADMGRSEEGDAVAASAHSEEAIVSSAPQPILVVGDVSMAKGGKASGGANSRDGLRRNRGERESRDSRDRSSRKPSDKDAGRKRDGREKERKPTSSDEPMLPSKPPVELDTVNFPPLAIVDDKPIPTPGYKTTFQKYSFDDIIMIVKSVKEASLPPEINPREHLVAMTPETNMDLLKRQRTFTIDETREQLRLGRPVQREAILPGDVDYRSMMYGDESQPQQQHKQPSAALESKKTSDQPPASEPACAATVSEAITSAHTTASSPPSPARISAASWAAMVKSTQDTSPDVLPKPAPLPLKPISATNKSSKPKTESKKEESKPKGAEKDKASRRRSRDRDHKDKEHRHDKAERSDKLDKPDEGENLVDNDDEEQGESLTHRNEKACSEAAAPPAEDQTPSKGSAWGGKATFANVLKQASETDILPLPTSKPTSTETSNYPKKESSINHKAAKGHQTNGVNRSSRGQQKEKSSPITDSDGMWVREQLPALDKK